MFEELLGACYEAVMSREGWHELLHQMRLALNSRNALLMFSADQQRQIHRDVLDTDFWQTYTLQNLYYDQYQSLNPIDYPGIQPGRIFAYEDFISREDFERSRYYREFCVPMGNQHALVACVDDGQGIRAWFNFSRDDVGGAYGEPERTLFAALLPHLERAVRLYAFVESLRTQQSAFRRTADHLGLCTLLLDEQGRVLTTNHSAQQLLGQNPLLRLSQRGGLQFTGLGDEQAFHQALRDVLQGVDDSVSYMIGAHTHDAVGLLLRRLTALPGQRLPGAAVVAYLRPRQSLVPVARIEHVGKLFGLTPTEARFAVLLAEGESLQTVAERLGITEQTARTYCKRIFSKTGTSRQADLVRLVITSVASLVESEDVRDEGADQS
ncbi:helix-turn-helix transcriptional regulator [Haliea atlantica]